MLEKDKAREIYFDGCKVQRFTTITPAGNEISGWAVKDRTHLYGSLLIDTLNGEEVEQFVRGMPKLHYYNTRTPIDWMKWNIIHILEKLDGTNIIAFPLKDTEGKVIEVCFKTRSPNFGIGMVAGDFLSKIHEIWDDRYETMVRENNTYSFAFELYGTGKLHNDVKHEFVNGVNDVNMDLIAVFKGDMTVPYPVLAMSAEIYGVPYVNRAFHIIRGIDEAGIFYHLEPTKALLNKYGIFATYETKKFKSPEEAIEWLRFDYLERMNERFQLDHSGVIIEGCIWQVENEYGTNAVMLKNKANGVHEGHIKAGGIPSLVIRKAVRKAHQNLDITKSDMSVVMTFVEEELKEEFKESEIQEKINQDRIKANIGNYKRALNPKPVEEEYIEIAREVCKANPELTTPQDYMRVFASNPEYADKRKYARKMFSAFNTVLAEAK